MCRSSIFILIFLCVACASKSIHSEGKATRDSSPPVIVELTTSLELGPPALESGIVTNSAVLDCLRQGLDPADFKFSVRISGQLTADGAVENQQVSGGPKSLNVCLNRALGGLKLDSVPLGPFRLSLARRQPGQSKDKGFSLELSGIKKFE